MSNIHQLANQNLDSLVVEGNYMGGINAHLMPNIKFANAGTWEKVPPRLGEKFKINESQVATGLSQPSTPVNKSSRTVKDRLFNGKDGVTQKHGHFELEMFEWDEFTEQSVTDCAMAFADTSIAAMKFIGETAVYTAELQSRRKLNAAYLGGNSYVTEESETSTDELALADTNGFTTVYEVGIPFPVSNSHPLQVTIKNTVLGTVTRNVIDCVQDDLVEADDTVPGVITLSSPVSEIAVGDNVTSSQCPPHIAPGGKSSPYDIDADDVLTFQNAMDIFSTLTSHAASPLRGVGGFLFVGDTTHQAQFWRDAAFRDAYSGQYNSKEMREGAPVKIGNVLFDFSHRPARSVNESGATVRRAVILAEGALIRGHFDTDPKDMYNWTGPTHNEIYDNVNHYYSIISKPIDRLAKIVTFSFLAYWGFTTRTSHLAQFGDFAASPYKLGCGLFSG